MSAKSQSGARADVYTRITEEIIAAIDQETGEWRAPWFHDGTSSASPTNLASGKRYRGINTLALWVSAMTFGYSDGLWGTYRQWQDVGAQVRKGERSTTVVLWKPIDSSDREDDVGEEAGGHRRMIARAFSVFNVGQVDGYARAPVEVRPDSQRLEHADAFISNLGIKTEFGGGEAFYSPSQDTVFMQDFASFCDPASFYGVWLHEMGHASGAKHRLDRDLSGRFGTQAYAAEECCVEILAGLVLADLGIAHHPRPEHAAYIASWLKVLKEDPRAIFTAASKAQQAADWMHAKQPEVDIDWQPSLGLAQVMDAGQPGLPALVAAA